MFWDNIKNWMILNIRALTAVFAGSLVVLAIAAGILKYMEHRGQKGVEALYQARQKVEAMTLEQKQTEGASILKNVSDSYSGTRAGFEALIATADLYSDAKNFPESIKYYEMAVKKAPDDFAKSLALYNKGTAEEFSGLHKEAITTYMGIEKIKPAKFLLPEILLAQARCHELLKDFSKATEIYQRVQSEFPQNTYYSNAATAFMEKLKTQVKN